MVTKNQHYVPSLYLKNWKCAYLIDKDKIVSIGSVCKEKFFYSSRDEQNGVSLESVLSTHLESPFSNLLRGILDRCEKTTHGQRIMSPNDVQIFAYWCAAQLTRTPTTQFLISKSIKDNENEVLYFIKSTLAKENIDGFIKLSHHDPIENGRMLEGLVETMCQENELLPNILNNGIFYISKSIAKNPFLTSDNPVIISKENECGHGLTSLMRGESFNAIFLPLSPRIKLVIHDKRTITELDYRHRMMAEISNNDYIDQFNDLIIANANNCILLPFSANDSRTDKARLHIKKIISENGTILERSVKQKTPETLEQMSPGALELFNKLVKSAKSINTVDHAEKFVYRVILN